MRGAFSTRIGVAIVLLLLFGGLVAFSRQRMERDPGSSMGSPTESAAVPRPTLAVVVPEEWPTYVSEKQEIRLRHPDFAQVREIEGVLVLYHHGPTQTEGTELFDGFTITVQTVPFAATQESLKQVADDRLADDRQHATITRGLSPIELAGQTGWQYQISGVGEYTIIVLPHGERQAVVLSYLVADPDDRAYEQTVQQMLASLELLS